MPQPTGRPNARLRQTVGDMVRSMAIVLGVIGVIMLVTWRPQPDAVRVVPIQEQLTLAQMQADFTVLTPVGLTEQWRSTSARWEPTQASDVAPVWHVGYVTPSDEYLQFTQVGTGDTAGASVNPEAFIAEQTVDGSPGESVTVGGQVWERWESGERRSLVLTSADAVTVVSGTGDWPEIEQYAGALRPAQ